MSLVEDERDDGTLVYFRGGPWNAVVRRMPDSRDRWAVPHTERRNAFYFGTSLGPLPQPALYERTWPREYERVLLDDVNVKKGMRLEDFSIPWGFAVVFDCVAEGGR